MKKLISCLSAAAMLFTATAIAPATTAADLPVLKADSVIMMTRDGSAVCGTNGAISAADLAAEFDGSVTVKDPAGNVIDGEIKVPAGSTVSTEVGSVGVLISGDASMDGNINLTDVSAMLKQIAGWTVTVDTAAADVDNTSKINLSDVSTVLKFIAGWDVKLGYKKVIVDEEPQTAANEDADTVLWTDHSTAKTERSVVESTGKCTYLINAAKNEAEGATVFISPSEEKKNVTVSVTDFVNSYGDTVEADAYIFHYHNMKDFGYIPDAIMPEDSTYKATVKPGESQGFFVNATTTEDSIPGLYEATLSIMADGAEIKRAKIYLNVWDLTLDDADAPRSSFGFSKLSASSNHNIKLDDPDAVNAMYKTYYDFLLEHRMCAYVLPYGAETPEADEYLNDPRVNSFVVYGKGYGGVMDTTLEQLQARYEKLKGNPDWFEKAYFYCADEPFDQKNDHEISQGGAGVYADMRAAKALIDEYFPGGKQVVPFVYSRSLTLFDGFFELYRETVDILCGKTYAFVSPEYFDSYLGNGDVWRMNDPSLIRDYGSYKNYINTVMAEDENKENWWYFAELPIEPLTTYTAHSDGMYVRMSGFQMYKEDVTGVLYYAVDDYGKGNGNSVLNGYGLEFKISEGDIAWGNGIMVYSGMRYGIDGPVGSVRLEYIRDSFEDYMYLALAERTIGKEVTDELVRKVVRDMVDFETDAAKMQAVRAEIAEAIMAETAK